MIPDAAGRRLTGMDKVGNVEKTNTLLVDRTLRDLHRMWSCGLRFPDTDAPEICE